LDFCSAAGGGLCNWFDSRERPVHRNSPICKAGSVSSIAGTLSAGSGIHANETIKTGSSGQAGLQFNDRSNLSVGPSSQVRLDKFVYDPSKGASSVAIEATRGAFRFASQGKGEVKVKTPSGTLGIRG
jgi:hypothetical protein